MTTIRIQLDDIWPYVAKNTDTPMLAYCRKLIKDGVDPKTCLEVYRGDVMAIRIKEIGIGATLAVQENSSGTPVFVKCREKTAS